MIPTLTLRRLGQRRVEKSPIYVLRSMCYVHASVYTVEVLFISLEKEGCGVNARGTEAQKTFYRVYHPMPESTHG